MHQIATSSTYFISDIAWQRFCGIYRKEKKKNIEDDMTLGGGSFILELCILWKLLDCK